MIAGTIDENTGRWMDGWSPREMLISHRLEQLLGADAVHAVGAAIEGEAGDITVAVDRSDAQRGGAGRVQDLVLCAQGESSLASLRNSLKAEFERAGNRHWGMENDVKHLAQALTIGFLVFADGLQMKRHPMFSKFEHAQPGGASLLCTLVVDGASPLSTVRTKA